MSCDQIHALSHFQPCDGDATTWSEVAKQRAQEYCAGLQGRGWYDPEGVPVEEYNGDGNTFEKCDVKCFDDTNSNAAYRRSGIHIDGTPCNPKYSGSVAYNRGYIRTTPRKGHCVQGECMVRTK